MENLVIISTFYLYTERRYAKRHALMVSTEAIEYFEGMFTCRLLFDCGCEEIVISKYYADNLHMLSE